MTSFAVGKPVVTRMPTIEVDAGLKPGNHRFQLEVVDNSGNRSRPVQASVLITERGGGTSGPGNGPGNTPPGRTGGTTSPGQRVDPTPVRKRPPP